MEQISEAVMEYLIALQDPQQTEVRIQSQSTVQPWQILSFDLSRGNSIFGASDTNQPKSLRSLCLIRSY